MQIGRTIKASAFAAAVTLFAASAQAARLGHPGVSTTATKGAPTQWQLLCDPADVTNGSTTTSYSAYDMNGLPLASLGEVDPLSGFAVTSVELQVETPLNPPSASMALNIPANQFTSSFIQFTPTTYGGPVIINQSAFPTGAHETGIVQIFWEEFNSGTTAQPGDLLPPQTDVNVYSMLFNNMSGNPNAMGTFQDYLDPGSANGGITPTPDFYSGDNPDPFTYSADPNSPNFVSDFDTESVTVQVGTPEPSSIALVGAGCALGMLRRRRR